MQIQNAHSRFELLLPFALCLALTFPPSTSLTPPSCTSYPGQFLPPVWGTSNIVGFGGQDVSLIITQSDLHPAPDSLPLAPDTSFACGGLERRGGGGWTYGPALTARSSSRGMLRIFPLTDTTPWSTNWLILRSLSLVCSLPLLPLGSTLLP